LGSTHVYQNLKGAEKDRFLAELKTKGKKDLSWIKSFKDETVVNDRQTHLKQQGHYTMFEIFSFNKVDTRVLPMDRVDVVFQALLRKNIEEFGYEPVEATPDSVPELTKYFYIHIATTEERVEENKTTSKNELHGPQTQLLMSKTLGDATDAPINIKLENPHKHALMQKVAVLRSAIVVLDKKFIDLKEMRYDLELKSDDDELHKDRLCKLNTICGKLESFIQEVRDACKGFVKEEDEEACGNKFLAASEYVVLCKSHVDGHKELKKRFAQRAPRG
jgi:hypothetical protein